MRMVDIIEKKRDGYELTEEEIQFFINGYTEGTIPDYQASALCMAIYFNGMTDEERAYITMAIVHSGETIDLAAISGIKVDKHSTGGVGDTTTLVLAPLVASVGVPVAKMSGRGLGHTGGTIDKLESVPGFNVELDKQQFINLVNKNHVAVMGQSGNLTPADKQLYGLRDVTATVNSIPLIASSIMSKKIAAGADAIVLDVKTGAGAFMKSTEEAQKLAKAMVDIGNQVNRHTMAVISDMSQPLGRAIGNALEVKEAIDTLRGEGPEDLTELCLTLGSQMVVLAKKADTLDQAKQMLEQSMENDLALEKFRNFLRAQGGDDAVIDDQSRLPQAANRVSLLAKESGYIQEMVADEIGTAAMMLGAGRATKESIIDHAVGIFLHKKVGDYVEKDEPILTIHANDTSIEQVKEKLYSNITIQPERVDPPTLIQDIITK
ncbi:pyrimidine-nucleoside phosphorylase [Salirhabdus salicampi]|uniref:pyrimidine-nucleoside phosphorylase n=1 Tax=Salirhabdus salicampi TaxID=476102 RepID=UPI0020C527DD|nr:pyrimidine-nucleoside phosphorylase [Salirhabdus salicampi]MCP8616767.1 pyrimidine-nucleoside phosphorylase [Salirhabdus salicampi]